MTSDGKGAIVFGEEKMSPEQYDAYKKKIEDAKKKGVNSLKGSEPLGSVPRPVIPDFQKLREERSMGKSEASGLNETGGVQPRPPGSPVLTSETSRQLKEMSEVTKEEVAAEEKKEEESLLDILDFADQRSEAEKLLNNKKRREEIEARCEPMKFEDLLYKNEVQQKIPIIPGKFEPTLRSITPEESLFVKRFIAKEQAHSDQYTLEKYNLCLLTCSLLAINDSPVVDHRDKSGSPDDTLFEAKLKVLLKKSGYIISDLGVNYTWFDIRVRKLITADGLKNG